MRHGIDLKTHSQCQRSQGANRLATDRSRIAFRFISGGWLVEPIGIEPMTPCLQSRCSPSRAKAPHQFQNLVGPSGFEPPTSPLSGVRSNQLSYRPTRATAGLKAAGGVSQLRRKHKRPRALSVSPVMKGHEDDGNVLWKTAKLFRWLASALSRISLERR